MARGLDANTAFQIVSIDIADIDVGENIGARLQSDQAEADARMGRARAEARRAEAVARQTEMVAKVTQGRARLVLAEAEIPAAIAVAFRAGQLRTTRPPSAQKRRLGDPRCLDLSPQQASSRRQPRDGSVHQARPLPEIEGDLT